MKYQLSSTTTDTSSLTSAIAKFWPLLQDQRLRLLGALVSVLVSSFANLLAPLIIGHAVDAYIQTKQFSGVLMSGGVLFIVYVIAAITTYVQTKLMGGVGQQLLFTLRSEIFMKLAALPLAFFNQNKTGDLISRINNDTDKLNQFFSQALVQFVNNAILMAGAAVFLVVLNVQLGIAALVPAAALFIFTQLISPWIKKRNSTSLKAVGDMSAEVSESLDNFKLIAVFNRRDYFRSRFQEVNEANYRSAVGAGIANNTLVSVYGLTSNIAQLIILLFGIYLILQGSLTVGLLVSYLAYVSRFYDPIRQIASIWSTFQVALAGWDRIAEILNFKSDMTITEVAFQKRKDSKALLTFDHVSFEYDNGKEVLHDITFTLERGKTYAFVGPTGGGKTTTASLMARLYDPTTGTVYLDGQDIRSIPEIERTQKIGFILQEPFLFSGTIRDNIVYGNHEYQNVNSQELETVLKEFGLLELLKRFPQGLDSQVSSKGSTLSLGQQQLIAFMRAVLRKPALLILDEATANVDTVTEKLLDDILAKLPASTTRVIIAHRFNTIENADDIFFVNAGTVKKAGSLKHAMELLLKEKRAS